MPGTVPGARDAPVSKTDNAGPHGVYILLGEAKIKKRNLYNYSNLDSDERQEETEEAGGGWKVLGRIGFLWLL